MWSNRLKRKTRPSYPSRGRQWFGIFATAFSIATIEGFARNGHRAKSPASIMLLAVMVVTYWSGLRAGIIATAISFAYFIILYAYPGTLHVYTPDIGRGLLQAAFVFLGIVYGIGLIQGRMRNAGIREFDAAERAEAEAEQRLQTEGVLRSTEDMWRVVVDSATDAIIVIDESGAITLWNASAESIFGWKDDEVIGKLLSDTIVPYAYREAHAAGIEKFASTGEATIFGQRLEFSALGKDGREFPVELIIVPHLTGGHHIFIGFVRDLTDQRKLNERLRQAQKMEAIGTLAAGIAHDFNNILAAISGNLTLARSDVAADDPAQESLAEVEKAVSRATNVVRQILTFSSVKEPEAQSIDLGATLHEAIQLLRTTIPASIEIEELFESNLPTIVANTTDIHQIILNLGINANQAMEGQNGRFEVRAIKLTLDESKAESLLNVNPGTYIRLSVGDTGSGMDEATLTRIFEPFFTTKTHGEGTGLGLAVVYGIVERLHGAISVYSEPGEGTVFHLYFPVAEGDAPTQAVVSPDSVEDISGHGERILYVDDDEALVFMMTRMLRRLGYEVTGFQHSREALEAFKANPHGFDLLITDMSMPHMDGRALVKDVQTIRPSLPIVMVTGYIRPKDLEQTRELGIRELLLKPSTFQEMGTALHRIVTELRAESGISLK